MYVQPQHGACCPADRYAGKQASVANRLRRLDRVVLCLGSKEKGANIDSNGRAVVSQNERLNAPNALDNGREAWYLATAYVRVKTGERELRVS